MKRDWNFLHFMALIPLVVGFGILLKNLYVQHTGTTTEGKVISLVKRAATSRHTSTYYPVVTFDLENGESRTVNISRQSSNRLVSHRVGDTIPLVYPKDDYKKVQINSFSWIYGFPGILTLVGMILWFLAGFDFENAP